MSQERPNKPTASREMMREPIPEWALAPSPPREPMPDLRPKEISEEEIQQELAMIRSKRNGLPPLASKGLTPFPSAGRGQALLEHQRRLAMEAQGRV